METDHVVVAAGARTPFGNFGGSLRAETIPELASTAAREALRRADTDAAEVDEMVVGVNLPGSDRSLARQAQIQSGIPEDRVAYTVDRACCSGLTAISCARQSLLLGRTTIAVAGGAENLSLVPYYVRNMRWGNRLGHVQLVDQLIISCPHTGVPRAIQAAEEAAEYAFGRAEQDAWALRSQQRAGRAIAEGKLAEEIVPMAELERDEPPRPETTLETLSRLKTVNGSATVTAGNAPGLNTGSSMTVLMRESTAAERGLRPLARILASVMVSGDPQRLASMPAVAVRKVLDNAGTTLRDIALIEVNEAFAAVPLVTTEVLARHYGEDVESVRARTNVNGGAIAIGHPTGASGGRLLLTLALELRRRGGGLGVVTICGGIGEAESVLIGVDA